jgi:uncharacterized protein YbjT (DUF2867 family)
MNILVIGSGGNIGTPLVEGLIAKGIKPRLGVRNLEKAQALWGDQAEIVKFDYEDSSSFAAAVKDQTAIFFIAGHPNPVPSVQSLLQEAEAAGVQKVVFSSGRTTGDVPGKPLNDVEQLVQQCKPNWTILRPGWFMQNFINWLGGTIRAEDKLFLPAGDAKTAFVDVRDIAEVAIKVLLEEGHRTKTYNLTSDEALDHAEVCQLISQAAGRTVQYIPQDRHTFIKTMQEKGWTQAAATYTADLYEYVLSGKEEEISPDVAQVLGRAPRRLKAFTEEYADRF